METKQQQKRKPEINTAVQIVKGSILKVLNQKVLPTISVNCLRANEGRITIPLNRKFNEEELQQIENLSNDVIQRNIDVLVYTMERKELEKVFDKNAIYDKVPPPENIEKLTVVEIKDWNINCCPGDHVKSTGYVRPIRILRQNLRENKMEVELVFELLDSPGFEKPPSSTRSTSLKNVRHHQEKIRQIQSKNNDSIENTSFQIISDVLKTLKNQNIELKQDQETVLHETLKPLLESRLVLMKNSSYSKGFMAAMPNSIHPTLLGTFSIPK